MAAFISITGNDFSNASVVASGTSTATINLLNNYWGTTNPTNIAAKITDHVKNSSLPTVLYTPFLDVPPADLGTIQGVVFNDINGNGVQDSGEPGIAGVLVYVDANDNGVLDPGELSTVTQADNPITPVNEAGDFSFPSLAPGTYVVREQAPVGTIETTPSASSVTNTIDFDGTGAESGITGAGVTSFTYHGASFSGGTIFAASQSALLASGALAYNATSGSAQVNFSLPISSVTFFYVSGDGFGAGTATAFGPDGTNLGSVNSKTVTTKDDPNNFVTLSFAQPIAQITFSGGVIDHFSFTTVANDQAAFVHVAASQTVSGITLGNQSTVASTDLVATSVTPTTTGFTAAFSLPVNAERPQSLRLLGHSWRRRRHPVGQTIGPVDGSLLVSPDGTTITFIKTGGILAPDTYTITLYSGPNAFETTTGALLDGNGDGTPGDNLTYTFTVDDPPGNAVIVGIPDFTRGYGQPVNLPATSDTGLPITLSTGENVSGVDLTLNYNPELLTLSGFTTTIAGASAVFNVTTPGTAIITVSGAGQFASSGGTITLGDLTAAVPDDAPYGSKEILSITNLTVFDDSPGIPQPLPSIADDAIHVAAYFGDTNGDQTYDTPDASLDQRVIGLVNTGFAPYRLIDPVLLGRHHAERRDPGERHHEHSASHRPGERAQHSRVADGPDTSSGRWSRPHDLHSQRERRSWRHRYGPRRADGDGRHRHHRQWISSRHRLRPNQVDREFRLARRDVPRGSRVRPRVDVPGTRPVDFKRRVRNGHGHDPDGHDDDALHAQLHRGRRCRAGTHGHQPTAKHIIDDDGDLRQ